MLNSKSTVIVSLEWGQWVKVITLLEQEEEKARAWALDDESGGEGDSMLSFLLRKEKEFSEIRHAIEKQTNKNNFFQVNGRVKNHG